MLELFVRTTIEVTAEELGPVLAEDEMLPDRPSPKVLIELLASDVEFKPLTVLVTVE